MLSIPTYTQGVGDPRTIVQEVSAVQICNNVNIKTIDDIGAHYQDPTVHSMGGNICNGDDLWVCEDLSYQPHGRLVKVQVDFETARGIHPAATILDSRDNVVMNPVNNQRGHYYQRSVRELGMAAIYAFIYQHVLQWNYVNVTARAPDPMDYFIGSQELVPAFDDFLFEALTQLTGAVEDIANRNPDLVLELKLFNNAIYIIKYCDYRTWLYLEKEHERLECP